jgi:alkanesulfonate monooxygenase SsuD/methylene tetrahydromethanopterin reductase-like flavin-dependent oxidoreductase (luciferase family)
MSPPDGNLTLGIPRKAPSFRLGLLTHVAGDGASAKVLRETIELFAIAEQLGFHSAWVAQHHVRAENGHPPSPFVFLAAAAERTSHLRLGTGIVMLPLEDPLRVAEDAAVADLLSGGRLELGLGTGGDTNSYTAFGRSLVDRREQHRQARKRLNDLLDGKPAAGDLPLNPLAPGLGDRIWWATGSDDSAREAGSAGKGILLARGSPQKEEPVEQVQLALIAAYRSNYAHDYLPPRIGITRTIYPAASRAESLAAMEQGVRGWSARMLRDDSWQTLAADRLFARHNIYTGTPTDIAEALSADQALGHATDLLIQVQPGEPGFARTVRALTTIALDIAPALGWQRATA